MDPGRTLWTVDPVGSDHGKGSHRSFPSLRTLRSSRPFRLRCIRAVGFVRGRNISFSRVPSGTIRNRTRIEPEPYPVSNRAVSGLSGMAAGRSRPRPRPAEDHERIVPGRRGGIVTFLCGEGRCWAGSLGFVSGWPWHRHGGAPSRGTSDEHTSRSTSVHATSLQRSESHDTTLGKDVRLTHGTASGRRLVRGLERSKRTPSGDLE